jgi:hypothetical protein
MDMLTKANNKMLVKTSFPKAMGLILV